jgi:hypothetical protein
MRLERLYKGAVYKNDSQLQLPIKAGRAMIATLLEAFTQLVPADE